MGLFTQRTRERERRDELLSAYLDGELSAEERARLEAQLASDPALQAELEALRHTVALMHDLPQVPIPRNFILPQTMVARLRPAPSARPRRAWAAPLLTAATAVVSLLFVVVLAGDLLFFSAGRLAFAPASAPQMEAEVPQSALAPSLVSEEVQVEAEMEKAISAATPPPMPMEVPLEAMPTATIEAEHYAVGASEGEEATAPAMDGGDLAEEEGTPSPREAAGGGPTEETTTSTPPPRANEVEEAAAAPTAPGEMAEVAPLAVGEGEDAEATEGEWGAPEIEPEDGPGIEGARLALISPWRVVEVVLGLTGLVLALAAVWAWRARRR